MPNAIASRNGGSLRISADVRASTDAVAQSTSIATSPPGASRRAIASSGSSVRPAQTAPNAVAAVIGSSPQAISGASSSENPGGNTSSRPAAKSSSAKRCAIHM